MKIAEKLVITFLTISLFVLIVGYFSANKAQHLLKEEIGKSSTIICQELMANIDKDINTKIEILELYFKNTVLFEDFLISNKEFGEKENIQTYIDQQDRIWVGSDRTAVTPFMEALIRNSFSQNLKSLRSYLKTLYGEDVFGEIFVTNKYGAIIALTNKTSDFFQADEQWWQEAKKNGLLVHDIEYDKSSESYSLSISFPIKDVSGNFLGVVKAVLNIDQIFNAITRISERIIKEQNIESLEIKLFTKDGNLIFSTKEHELGNGNGSGVLYEHLKENVDGLLPSYIEDVVNNRKMFIIVHSKGYSRYKGLGWILVLDYNSADIFEAVVILRNKLLGFSFLIAIISVLLGLLVAQSISKPILALKQASLEIGKGNLSAKIDIHTKDEIEELAKSFMQMSMQLQNTTVTKEYVENIIESMVDGVSIVDLDGKIVTINNAAVKQNGYTKKNILFGLKMEKIICEEDISKYEKIIKKLFLGEIAENEYLKFMRKNGSVYIARVNGSILTDKNGKPQAIIIVHQDVTDIKNTEEELKKNEERYRITSEQTGQLLFDYDPRTGKIKWFGAIEEITGYTKEEFGSVDVVSWTEKIHPSDRKEVLSMIEKAQKNCTKYDIQYRFRKKCGTYIFIEEHGVFLPDENGRVCRMCGTIIDVTERNEREKDIRERESFLASVIE
ncbi:MAG: PAS domain S-box protein, partial [Candidatus Omnitrophica bacterium]|nr:PAS domain S-box protein [Candidatus Omnitrophota bacterium]